MHDALDLLFLLHLVALLAVSLALVYPLATHAQNVAHSRAIVLQSLALFVLTLGIAAAIIELDLVVSEFLFTVSPALLVTSMWLYAREFVRRDDRFGTDPDDGAGRGAADAGRDAGQDADAQAVRGFEDA